MVGQPQRQVRPQDHQRQDDEHRQMERDGAKDHLAQLAVPNALDDEQIDADRRRDLAEFDEEHENDAEQQRIDAVARQHRKEQRHRDHDHAEAFDQAAEHGVEDEQGEKKLQPCQMQADDKGGYPLADARYAEGIGEDVGREDDEQDVPGKSDG